MPLADNQKHSTNQYCCDSKKPNGLPARSQRFLFGDHGDPSLVVETPMIFAEKGGLREICYFADWLL